MIVRLLTVAVTGVDQSAYADIISREKTMLEVPRHAYKPVFMDINSAVKTPFPEDFVEVPDKYKPWPNDTTGFDVTVYGTTYPLRLLLDAVADPMEQDYRLMQPCMVLPDGSREVLRYASANDSPLYRGLDNVVMNLGGPMELAAEIESILPPDLLAEQRDRSKPLAYDMYGAEIREMSVRDIAEERFAINRAKRCGLIRIERLRKCPAMDGKSNVFQLGGGWLSDNLPVNVLVEAGNSVMTATIQKTFSSDAWEHDRRVAAYRYVFDAIISDETLHMALQLHDKVGWNLPELLDKYAAAEREQAPLDDAKRAKRLQRIRLERGFSQSELSARSGVPVVTIQKLESGARALTGAKVETLLKLAKALHSTVEDLIGEGNA